MKKIFHTLCCICLVVILVLPSAELHADNIKMSTQLDTKRYKNQLIKVKIRGSEPVDYDIYYYDSTGNITKNKWVILKVGKGTYKYYFGKSGKAYKAIKDISFKNNIKLFKINNYSYGFDQNGKLVTGAWITAGFRKGTFVLLDKKGRLLIKQTNELRKAAKTGSSSRKLKDLLKKYAGSPRKSFKTKVCTTYKGITPKYATVVQYSRFEIQLFAMPNGSEIVYAALGALR